MARAKHDDKRARAMLAAIEKEAGTSSAAKAWLKFNALYGRHVMSRRVFLEKLTIQQKRTGVWEPWRFNGPQRVIEATRLRTVRRGLPERYAILKARKLGVSVYWIGALLDEVTRSKSMQAAIVGQTNDATKKLLRQSKQIRDHAPWKLEKRFDNQSQLYFSSPLDSSIDISSGKSDDPLRGATLRFVHVTEPQLWVGDPLKKRIAIEGCVVDEPGTLVSYEGTGFGRNWWHDFWYEALEGRSEKGFQAIFLSWLLDARFDYCDPVTPEEIEAMVGTLSLREEHLRELGASWGQIAWRRRKLRTTFSKDEVMFAQEYPSTPAEAFTSDGRPAFIHDSVDFAKSRCKDPVWIGDLSLEDRHGEWGVNFRFLEDPRGSLRIWERPTTNGQYAMGIDPSYGLGADNAVITVLDNKSGRQVAEFCSNRVEPHKLGEFVSAIGEHYNRAYALVEIQGPGFGVISKLKELEYPMIGMRAVRDEHGKVVGKKLGFSNDIHSRESIFNEIRQQLGDKIRGCQPRAKELCDEMFTMYRDEEGRICTPVGKKDDRVFSWGVALLARRDSLNPDHVPEEHNLPAGSLEERHWRQYEASVAEVEEEPQEDWSTEWTP